MDSTTGRQTKEDQMRARHAMNSLVTVAASRLGAQTTITSTLCWIVREEYTFWICSFKVQILGAFVIS